MRGFAVIATMVRLWMRGFAAIATMVCLWACSLALIGLIARVAFELMSVGWGVLP